MTSNKAAGAILIASGIAAMGLMAMHPTGDSSDMMIAGVHGSLMIVLLAQAASVFWTLGAGTLREMIATVFYAAGVIATMAAGTLNGFVFPAMRAYGEGEIGHDIFDFIWWSNQMLAELGVIGIGIAFAIWSVGIWKSGERLLAGFGWIAGLAPVVALLSGHMGMDLHGAMAAYGIQLAWVIALGWTRWRSG